MNRIIKFRAFLKELNKMEMGLFGLRSDGKVSFNTDAILMQFTGLHDKNGKEIYEGDINEDLGILVWNQDDASYIWEYKDIDMQSMGAEHEWCIVIGNIYETPELLNK